MLLILSFPSEQEVPCFPGYFQDFLFCCGFSASEYGIPWVLLYAIFLAWFSLSFLDVWFVASETVSHSAMHDPLRSCGLEPLCMDVSRPVLEWAALPFSRCDVLSSVILGNPHPFRLRLCSMHCSSSLLRFSRVCVLSCHLTHSSWMLRSIFFSLFHDFLPCISVWVFSVAPSPDPPAGDPSSTSGSGRSTREGVGYPLQYSGLEKSMGCIVHGVTKSQTQLSDFHFLFDAVSLWRLQSIWLGMELGLGVVFPWLPSEAPPPASDSFCITL